ncbi:MAG: 2-C-methyl-D-erythritol 4-phosphate cytidylyltransferase [Lachnospiraceae bacterium]|nr:2-C-methyl-D-erythritol 4-phosphate cytidylyltransferase [Lachnospiraceae bacterium]
MENVAVLFAGGIGKRMNSGDVPKQFLEVFGKPILVYTIETFQKHKEISGIIVVCVETWLDYAKELVERYHLTKVKEVIPGGATGHESRLYGLRCARKYYDEAIVLIHDGVRPLIDADTISRSIACARENGSAVVCSPAIETIYREEGGQKTIIPREQCSLLRAPQCFGLTEILGLYEDSCARGNNDVIDSVTLMQMYGKSVPKVIGPAENIKITTPLDFYMFEGIMKSRGITSDTEERDGSEGRS